MERYKILGEKRGKWHLINVEDLLEGAAGINPSPPEWSLLGRETVFEGFTRVVSLPTFSLVAL